MNAKSRLLLFLVISCVLTVLIVVPVVFYITGNSKSENQKRFEKGKNDLTKKKIPTFVSRLEVNLKRTDGSAIEGGKTEIKSLDGNIKLFSTTNSNGVAVFEKIVSGKYTVEGSFSNLISLKPEEVNIQEGETLKVNLTLVEGIYVSGRILGGLKEEPLSQACIKVVPTSGYISSVQCILSSKDGYFTLGPLPPAVYRVKASKQGFETVTIYGVNAGKTNNSTDLQILLEKLVDISGKVTDNEGNPISKASVSYTPSILSSKKKRDFSSMLHYLDFDLPPSFSSLREDRSVDPRLIPSGHLGILKGELPDFRKNLNTTVNFRKAESVPKKREEDDECFCMNETDNSMELTPTATSDESGSFTLKVRSSSVIDIVVFHPDYEPVKITGFSPSDEKSDELKVVLNPGKEIPGRITDMNGNYLDGVHLWIEVEKYGLFLEIPVHRNGDFFVKSVDSTATIHASAPGFKPEKIKIDMRKFTPSDLIEIKLAPEGKMVEARVVDSRGFPVSGAMFYVEHGQMGKGGSRNSVTDRDGYASFNILAPGEWKIKIDHPSYFTLKKIVDAWDGEKEFVLIPAGGISGRVTDDRTYLPVVKFHLKLTSFNFPEIVLERDFENGAFVWTDIPAGDCIIEVSAEDYQTEKKKISVPPSDWKNDITLEDIDFWLFPLCSGSCGD